MGNFMGQVSPYLGTIILAVLILIMINRFRWKVVQLLAGMFIMGVLSGFFPALPGAINAAWKAILHACHLQ